MIRRRWFQFSLRGFLIAVTVVAVWFGWKVDRARKQREAVLAIEKVGGKVLYDWESNVAGWSIAEDFVLVPAGTEIPGPEWLRRLVGGDFFQDVCCRFANGTPARTPSASCGW